MKKYPVSNRAFTLVEVIVCSLIITIIALTGPGFNLAMRTLNQRVEERFAAISLADAQIEDLKHKAMADFTDPALDETSDETHATTLTNIPQGFSVSYTITDGTWGDITIAYKQVIVTSTYRTDMIIQRTAYIADIVY